LGMLRISSACPINCAQRLPPGPGFIPLNSRTRVFRQRNPSRFRKTKRLFVPVSENGNCSVLTSLSDWIQYPSHRSEPLRQSPSLGRFLCPVFEACGSPGSVRSPSPLSLPGLFGNHVVVSPVCEIESFPLSSQGFLLIGDSCAVLKAASSDVGSGLQPCSPHQPRIESLGSVSLRP
jgi:hypothetical protein